MKTEFIWWILVLTVVLILFPVIYYKIRKIYAKGKVKKRSEEQKRAELNADLEPFGFSYDEQQDAIYSGMYPWQRELGYCRLYDEAALALNMAIHSEPIYFYYNNRRWLIEFWKGQYGMTTGAEIGIYVTDKEDISIPGMFEGPFFDCVSDEERIQMQYILYRNLRPVFFRKGVHWWLTGFDVGLFTKPEHLFMEIKLTFPNRGMAAAFIQGLEKAGYGTDSYRINGNAVLISFGKPKTKQLYHKMKPVYHAVQWLNRFYCGIYRKVTKDYIKTLDKLDYLRFLFPRMYRSLTGIAKSKKMQEIFINLKEKAEETREVRK